MSKDFEFIDVHGHLNFSDYDKDRDEVISRARQSDVAMITVGTDLQSSKRAVELANNHENVWATVGIHPTEMINVGIDMVSGDLEELKELAQHPKVVAIGECGLDYFHLKGEDPEKEIEAQRDNFIAQIQIANDLNKPLMLHVRNGKGDQAADAYAETVELLKKHSKVRANFHFFAGTLEDLKQILDLNCMVSFTGVITFTKDYDALIRHASLTDIMSETDCPFVPPIPYRGKRNEPTYVIEVVKAIARIRNESEDKVKNQILQNAKRFFSLGNY